MLKSFARPYNYEGKMAQLADKLREDLGSLAQQLREGQINHATWSQRTREKILLGSLDGSRLGVAKAEGIAPSKVKLTPDQRRAANGVVQEQYRHFKTFSTEVATDLRMDKELTTALDARAQLYAGTVKSALGQSVLGADGGQLMRWVRYKNDSCETCLELDGVARTAEEWEQGGIWPAHGTICRGNCGCSLEPAVTRDGIENSESRIQTGGAMDTLTRFLSRLRELLRERIQDHDLSAAEFDEAVRQARSHVGGMVRWERARDQAEGNKMNTFRLLGEVSLSEDGTGRIQIFPPVGKYTHPRYGELDISQEFLQRVKANFDQKIYQQDLPLTIDLEHETKLSGAAGWIRDLEIQGDKGMWATVEFNDRGRSLVSDNAFRYFSPEFYDQWQDPASAQEYANVLIGGALTNRPFFKGMAPVVMAVEGVYALTELAEDDMDEMRKKRVPKDMPPEDDDMMMADTKTEDGVAYPKAAYLYTPDDVPSHWKLRIWDESKKVTKAQLGAAAAALGPGFRGQKVALPAADKAKAITRLKGLYRQIGVSPDEMPGHLRASLIEAGLSEAEVSAVLAGVELGEHEGGNAVGMTEDEARQLTEMRDSLKSLSERLAAEEGARKAAEESAKTAGERVAALERESSRRVLSEFVREHRYAFQGEVPECVDKLEKLQAKLGEDFDEYLAERRSLHERIKASDLFTQTSRPVVGGSVEAELDAATRKLMADNPQLTKAAAIAKVASENPDLYARYDRAFKSGIKRGGE